MATRYLTMREALERNTIPEPNSGCLLWLGASCAQGRYGAFGAGGRRYMAHRAAYELACGAIPNGLHGLHRCDVTLCVNPDHLFLGTHLDNMRDMGRKGRAKFVRGGASFPGEKNARAVLSPENVIAIRGATKTISAIARQYGVSRTQVRDIRSGRSWAHLRSAA